MLLLIKVDKIPVSLALAQAVIESGWGTSGLHTRVMHFLDNMCVGATDDGMIPNDRETDENIKLNHLTV